ncbi:glycoside hydrolase family 13 protein [Roseburia sp. 499]|uniref:glycoside hydrolase family 13 protein n=1 Tax=Roseburia sp. 499 TaxID=1261634 RepID=UPI0009523840|nr:glycoside hydrolase family 13 protein [Roseburia sp. 499]WVK70171.1 glycoside hydrolase family 13 protein [Roseburia sp. 499]
MNECAMLHIPDSRYCFATGEKELVLRLRMAREDEKAKVFLVYAQKYDFTFCRKKLPMEIKYSDRLYNYYEIKMRLEDVRFAYIFQIEEDGNTWYFSEDGVTKEYKFEEGFYNFFQMPYINKNDVMDTVDWMRSAVFYQIFVERFRQGNEKKDTSYINMKWDEKPTPKSFAGGDLAGIIEKMDYLKELGINALYLTPVFRSISNHKYDIIDYFTVDPQFGTKEELRQLVKLAHENGIRVVLDAVFNHCSMEMQQFQDVLEKGRESRFYDWFIIDGDFPEPEKMNYECFAACNYMPKLNTANEEVQDFLLEIAIYWIREVDIDGWRLDVSDEVSHDFWRRFRKAVKKEKPDSVIIGENWHDAYAYLMGDQYDSIMNYAFTKACLDYFAKGVFSAKDMADKLNSNLMRNTEQVNRMMLNLLDSHDTHRFFTEVNKDKDKMLAAIALEMVFEGAPCLYYGTELCMEGGYDPDSRRGFPWDTNSWDMDFLEKVKELIRIRKQPAVQYGEIKIEEEQEMLHVERMWENSKIILRINMTEEEKKIPKQPEETVLCEDNRFLITITEA